MKTVFGAIAMVVIVLACLYSFVYYLKRIRRWKLLDTQLSATITDIAERVYRTRNRRHVREYSYTYVYRYAGKDYSCTTDWISDEHKAGDMLAIKIASSNPGRVLSNVDYSKSLGGLIVCLFGAILGAIVLIVIILNACYG